MEQIVGTVTGLREVSPYSFWVRVSSAGVTPAVDDLIRVDFERKGKKFSLYGMVVEITTMWDGTVTTGYQEEAFANGVYQGTSIYLARIIVTRVLLSEGRRRFTITSSLPPPVGEKVYLTSAEESEVALGFDLVKQSGREVPVGILPSGEVAYLDLKFLLGDNGAHINVSGQSGVAAKTSYATFLLWMITHYPRENPSSSQYLTGLGISEARSLIFNVKGESLLFLDHWNTEWEEAKTAGGDGNQSFQEWLEMFEKFGVKPRPFENVRFLAAPKDFRGTPYLHHHRPQVSSYGWDILDIVELNLFPLMFDPEELSSNPNFLLASTVIDDILHDGYERLVQDAKRELASGEYSSLKISIDGLSDRTLVRTYLAVTGEEPAVILERFNLPNSFEQLIKMMRVTPEEKGSEEEGSLVKELRREQLDDRTILAISRRLRVARRIGLNRLWKSILYQPGEVKTPPVPEYALEWNRPGGATVVDVSKLHTQAQAFVVGAVLREIMFLKESELLEAPVFVYLDELNKYAPRVGGGPLGSIFRDVAERGRSFRVVLIGAEQTASQVDYRVITQAATTVVGRQKHAELSREEYAHLRGALREKATTLLPGEVIIDQPFLQIPVTVKFPLTPWATSEEGRGRRYLMQDESKHISPEEDIENLLA